MHGESVLLAQVFDGRQAHWTESDPCQPINVYGATKLEAEQLIQVHQYHLCQGLPAPARLCILHEHAHAVSPDASLSADPELESF